MKRLVVLDLYGTAVHITKPTNPFKRLAKELGISGQDARRVALTESFPDLSSFVRRVAPGSKLDVSPYEKDLLEECRSVEAFPETRQILAELRAAGLRTALISNLSFPYKRPFDELGLAELFDFAVFSFETGFTKPDPRIYMLPLSALGIPPDQALMAGDNLKNDVHGPMGVGMDAVLLSRGESCPEGAISSLSGLRGKIFV